MNTHFVLVASSSSSSSSNDDDYDNRKPTKISKILLPMELETAISPCPCLATMTDVSKSGTLVPAAKKVNPIITIGT